MLDNGHTVAETSRIKVDFWLKVWLQYLLFGLSSCIWLLWFCKHWRSVTFSSCKEVVHGHDHPSIINTGFGYINQYNNGERWSVLYAILVSEEKKD